MSTSTLVTTNTLSLIVGVHDAGSIRCGASQRQPQVNVGYDVTLILFTEEVCDALISAATFAKSHLAAMAVPA